MYENLTVREYKRCVSSWANACDEAYRSLLWVLGSRANKDGYDWYNSYEDIRRDMRRGEEDRWVPSVRTLKRYVAALSDAGVVDVRQTRYYNRGKTLWGANVYVPNFERVLVGGRPSEYDFLAPLAPTGITLENGAVVTTVAPGWPPDGPRMAHKISI